MLPAWRLGPTGYYNKKYTKKHTQCDYKLSSFNAHAMVLFLHIYMNVNKFCLNHAQHKLCVILFSSQRMAKTKIPQKGNCTCWKQISPHTEQQANNSTYNSDHIESIKTHIRGNSLKKSVLRDALADERTLSAWLCKGESSRQMGIPDRWSNLSKSAQIIQ